MNTQKTSSAFLVSFQELCERYKLKHPALCHRYKMLGITPERRGRKTFFSISQMSLLDGLNKFLTDNPKATIEEFLETQSRFDPSVTDSQVADECPRDFVQNNQVDSNFAANQLATSQRRTDLSTTFHVKPDLQLPSLDGRSSTETPTRIQELESEVSRLNNIINSQANTINFYKNQSQEALQQIEQLNQAVTHYVLMAQSNFQDSLMAHKRGQNSVISKLFQELPQECFATVMSVINRV